MRTLGRVLIILVAALVVVGVTAAVVQAGGTQGLSAGRGREGRSESGESFGDSQGFDAQRFFGGNGVAGGFRERGEGRAGSLSGLSELARNLVIVGGIVLAVVIVSKSIGSVRRILRRRRAMPG